MGIDSFESLDLTSSVSQADYHPPPSATTLAECLTHWARRQPDTCVASFWNGDGQQVASYTYAELETRTRALAYHFGASTKLAAGARVLLAYPPGLELIAAFVGCARAGIIPVPVCPPMPPHAASHAQTLLAIARDCGAAAVLTTTAGRAWRDSHDAIAVNREWSDLPWIATDDAAFREPAPANYIDRPGDILFLQYTSGSTRTPRGVIVTHDNMIRNGLATLDHRPIGVSWLPQYHDMGLIGYALYPIVAGGTTHWFSPMDFLRRPALWFELITRVGATCTSSPNFGLEYCLRSGRIRPHDLRGCDLSSLRVLMNAAEPVSPDTHRRFFETFAPYGLRRDAHIVAYGLAENTLSVTYGGKRTARLDRAALADGRALDVALDVAVDADVASDRHNTVEVVSCGTPVDGVELRVVAPGTRMTLADRHVGEIWVGGSSACRGYWANGELTTEPKTEPETFDTFHNTVDGLELKFIRTGDLGFVDRGELFVCGRINDVIIRRGRNYHSHDIERTVDDASPKVRYGAVAAIGDREEGSLVVIAEARRIGDPPDPADLARAIVMRNGIVPDRVVVAAPGAIERTTSGKMARALTRRKWLAGEIAILADHHPPPAQTSPATEASDERRDERAGDERRARITRTLASWAASAGDDCTLADAGLDSLTLVTLILDLEQLLMETTGRGGQQVDGQQIDGALIQACTLAQLRDLVARCECSPDDVWTTIETMASGVRAAHDESVRARMTSDARLGAWTSSDVHARVTNDSLTRVLLTGATGFFGPFLLNSLLTLTPFSYHVLIRARDRAAGLDRVREAMRRARLWTPALDREITARVTIVTGDLASPKLGLDAASWTSLARGVDMVVHNGAAVNYVASYDALRRTNVEGTRDLLRLACEQQVKELHFISSTVIFGWTAAPEVRETDRNDSMSNLDFGYAQTKWVAEQLVRAAADEGARAFIYRPSFISASTGGVASRDDIVVRLLAFMINERIAVNARNQVSFLPADLVAHNIASIVADPHRPAGTVHVTADSYYNLMDVTRILTRAYGYEFEYFDIPDFVTELRRRSGPADTMYPLLDFFTRSREKMAAMQHKRYSNTCYRLARERTGVSRPEPSLEATIDHLRAAMLSTGAIAR